MNEQEQHKTVNMEEYVENSSMNRFGEQEGSGVKEDTTTTKEDIGEVDDDTKDAGTNFTNMEGGAL